MGTPVTSTDTSHICVGGAWMNDTDVKTESNIHGDRWCSLCGERILTPRVNRKYVEGCTTCDYIRDKKDGFGPSHDASDRCESGRYDHCTCDTCF